MLKGYFTSHWLTTAGSFHVRAKDVPVYTAFLMPAFNAQLSKSLLLTMTAFAIFEALAMTVAAQVPVECPSISVSGPVGIPRDEEPVTFTATVDLRGATYEPAYEWSIRGGEIIDGQGSKQIRVRQGKNSLTATVEIFGLPPSCLSSASESMSWHPPPQPVKVGVFHGTNFQDNVEIFDEFAEDLNNNPSSQGLIFIGHPPATSWQRMYEREHKISDALTHKLRPSPDRSRLTIVRYENAKDVAEFWRIPPGANMPECEACGAKLCPKITVSAPAGIVDPGTVAVFSAEISDRLDSLSYSWTVKGGEIVKGQGSAKLEVRPSKYFNVPIKATVTVEGIPGGCENTSSESYAISCHSYLDRDEHVSFWSEYSEAAWKREQKELNSLFLTALKRTPEKIAYIEKVFKNGTTPREIETYLHRIKNFVHKTLKIPTNKLFFRVMAEGRPHTKLYLVPSDAPVLMPEWTEPCSK